MEFININFSDISRDTYGNIVSPTLILQKKSGGVIGVLGDCFNIQAKLKYNEVSNFTFDYPQYVNSIKTPFYDDLVADRIVKIDPYGVFVLDGYTSSGDGIKEVKSCTAYSLEYELSSKAIALESGTYRLYNPIDVSDSTTLMGRILEKAPNWSIGTVSNTLWSKYRTFDDTETKLYDWMMNTIQSTYNCIFLYDTYNRAINIIDADNDIPIVPVFLSYDNLIKQCDVEEVRDNMFTKLSVYGASDTAQLTIRDVNPIGSNYIYNIDYFIGLGDIPSDLATKWQEWQALIVARQQYYTALIGLRTAAYGKYLTAQSVLTDLNGDLTSLENLRSVNVQGLSAATDADTKAIYASKLSEIAGDYSDKEEEIEDQENLVENYLKEYNALKEDISAVIEELAINNYFTESELKTLNHYFIEDNFVDSTFAVYDVDVSGESDSTSSIKTAAISFSDITLIDVKMTGIWGCEDCNRHFSYAGTPTECPYCESSNVYSVEASERRLFKITGGNISISGQYQKLNADTGNIDEGDYNLSSAIVNGTIDYKEDGEIVCSFYLGSGTIDGTSFPSGNITIASTSTSDTDDFIGDLEEVEESDASTYYEGSSSLSISGGAVYFTRNVTESQRYDVAQELYDYAVEQLEDISTPTYSFDLSTANPIFAKEFEPFKNALKMGSACYLKIGDDVLTKQMLLEVQINFEDPSKFEMVFSNEFKRPSYTNKMKDLIQESASTSTTLELNRLSYGDTSGSKSAVSEFFKTGFDAALQQIKAGKDQCITINEAGIKVSSSSSDEYIVINNGMISLVSSDGTEAKMAMGHFYNEASGADYYGVLADIIGGIFLIGKNLIIECPDPNGGVMQFKVDGTGVIINNGRMYMQSDDGGKIGFDAKYGLFVGTEDLFVTTDTGYVKPSFINSNGDMVLDSDGFPQNVNVLIGIDGSVYVRGVIHAQKLYIGGTDVVDLLTTTQTSNSDSSVTSKRLRGNYIEVVNSDDDVTWYVDKNGNVHQQGYLEHMTSGMQLYLTDNDDSSKADFVIKQKNSTNDYAALELRNCGNDDTNNGDLTLYIGDDKVYTGEDGLWYGGNPLREKFADIQDDISDIADNSFTSSERTKLINKINEIVLNLQDLGCDVSTLDI